MKLATLDNGTRDGELVIVSADLKTCVSAGEVANTLQEAIENWTTILPQLEGEAKSYQHLRRSNSINRLALARFRAPFSGQMDRLTSTMLNLFAKPAAQKYQIVFT